MSARINSPEAAILVRRNLKAARAAAKLSLNEVVEKLREKDVKISVQGVHHLEKEGVSFNSFLLVKLAEVYGVKVEDFFREYDEGEVGPDV